MSLLFDIGDGFYCREMNLWVRQRRKLHSLGQMPAQYPNCKILLFSGQAATSDLLEGARARGYAFRLLQKPVHPSKFLFEIGQLSTGLLQALPLAESLMYGEA